MDLKRKVSPAISAAVLLGGMFVAITLYLVNQTIVATDSFSFDAGSVVDSETIEKP